MVERVNRYRTSDGLLLETLEDARAHEAWLELLELLREMPEGANELYSQVAWLIENREALTALLGKANNHAES